jgi:hypothetical protein
MLSNPFSHVYSAQWLAWLLIRISAHRIGRPSPGGLTGCETAGVAFSKILTDYLSHCIALQGGPYG